MEDNTSGAEAPQTGKDSKDRKATIRSASYPSETIEESEKFVLSLAKHFVIGQAFTREDVAAVLATTTSVIQRDCAVAVNYNFLIRNKDGYSISPKFKESVLNGLEGTNERLLYLIEAFQSPTLNAELLTKYDTHAVPPDLKTHLIRFHRIADGAAPLAADIFVASATYLGVLMPNGILDVNKRIAELKTPTTINNSPANQESGEDKQTAKKHSDEDEGEKGDRGDAQKSSHKTNSGDAEKSKKEPPDGYVEIPVVIAKGRVAYVLYPNNLTENEISVLGTKLGLVQQLIT